VVEDELPRRELMLYEKLYQESRLRAAWLRVKENKGAPGIDRVSCEDFEKNLESNLKSLQIELQEGSYKPLPVLRFYGEKKGGAKRRPIGIPAVRDRVVQHALLSLLTPIFEKEFLDCSFAYRPGRSAFDAIKKVEELIGNGHHWLLDSDIEDFFDSIDRELLLRFVGEKIQEDKIIKLIRKFLKAGVFEGMRLREEYLGITQGNVISPLLANIFLHRFDEQMTREGYNLVRYADDFIILEKSQEKIARAIVDVYNVLETLKLKVNERKTKIINVKEGFVFLGYYIDDKGKGASSKAIDAINGKLRQSVEAHKRKGLDERVEELKQIIRGWSAYFRSCRGIMIEDVAALIALVEISLEMQDEENAEKLLAMRRTFTEAAEDPNAHYRLGRLLQTLGRIDEALEEFSIALSLNPAHSQSKEALKRAEVVDEDVYKSIERLKRIIRANPNFAQAYRDLASCYAEVGEYGLAKEAHQKALALEPEKTGEGLAPPSEGNLEETAVLAEPEKLDLSDQHIMLFLSLFRGKRGMFARQWVDEKGRRGFTLVSRPMRTEDVRKHIAGEETLGIYLINEDGFVNLGVIDIDIDNKALLEYAKQRDKMAELHRSVQSDAERIFFVCQSLGVHTVIEDSGYKGRHLWFFFSTPIQPKLARMFLKLICQRAGQPSPAIHWEIFPNCDKLRERAFGPLIKLPLGVHKRSNRRCFFLDSQGKRIKDQAAVLEQIRRNAKEDIEMILLTYGSEVRAVRGEAEEQTSLVKNLLEGCAIVRALVEKAKTTHYLNHQERLTLLYTLGHLGEEGKRYLHKVISYTINYDYDVTENYIRKMKPNPISCPRVKEKHEELGVNNKCDCNFKVPKGGYPSPILHAFKRSPMVWPPTGVRETAKGDQPAQVPPGATEVPASEVQAEKEVAGKGKEGLDAKLKKYIEVKRQLRGVERSLRRIEAEMAEIFDRAGTDRIETEYGTLIRRKGKDKTEWIIEV